VVSSAAAPSLLHPQVRHNASSKVACVPVNHTCSALAWYLFYTAFIIFHSFLVSLSHKIAFSLTLPTSCTVSSVNKFGFE
jgi:hypothetical protein